MRVGLRVVALSRTEVLTLRSKLSLLFSLRLCGSAPLAIRIGTCSYPKHQVLIVKPINPARCRPVRPALWPVASARALSELELKLDCLRERGFPFPFRGRAWIAGRRRVWREGF